jgi:hypothetical protein
MQPKPRLKESMQEEQIREVLNRHWNTSAAGDANAEHDNYADDAICDYPQSGERILGRSNLQALRTHHPGKPSGFHVKRILGKGDLRSRNTQSPTGGDQRTQWALWSSATVRSCTRRIISRIPSRRQPGGANGFSGWRDSDNRAAATNCTPPKTLPRTRLLETLDPYRKRPGAEGSACCIMRRFR